MRFYNFICSILRALIKIFFRFEVRGRENMPSDGNIILISNHKSFLDPVFMLAAIENRRIIPVAKKELFKIPVLSFFMRKIEAIPIDRDKPGISTVKEILKQIKAGRVLGIFPEGTRSNMQTFMPAKPGVAMFAIKSKSNIVPMSIITTYRPFSKVRVIIDKPIDLTEHHVNKVPKTEYLGISQKLMDVVVENYNENKTDIIKEKLVLKE